MEAWSFRVLPTLQNPGVVCSILECTGPDGGFVLIVAEDTEPQLVGLEAHLLVEDRASVNTEVAACPETAWTMASRLRLLRCDSLGLQKYCRYIVGKQRKKCAWSTFLQLRDSST